MKKLGTKAFVTIGMLSAISYVLMLLDFPMPGFPTWLKIDFSDLPALIGAMIMGPVAGVFIELFKNLIDLLTTGTETGVPVGHIANFATGITYVLTTYFIYAKVKSKKGMTIALIAATLITATVMSVLNYFVFLPMYAMFMNFVLPKEIVATAIFPFNVVKGILIMIVFLVLYNKISGWMTKQAASYHRI